MKQWSAAKPWQLGLVGAATLLAFTPYHLGAILIAITLAALWRPKRSAFLDSFVSRFIAGFLLFGAVIMIVGMFCWLAGVALQPIFALGMYGVLMLAARHFVPAADNRGPWVNASDMLAGGAVLIGVGALLVSFYFPQPTLSASIQIITSGFDHGAHLSMIQSAFDPLGYLYGPYEEIKDRIAWETLTAYPQGWHLTNAVLWHGTGVDIFGGDSRSAALIFYAVTVLVWQSIAIFLFAKVALLLGELLGVELKLRQLGMAISFLALVAVVLVVVFWGSLYFGFASFIGALAYLMLLVAFLQETQASKGHLLVANFIAAGLAVTAIGLVWLLPVIAAVGMLALALAPWVSWPNIRLLFANRQQLFSLIGVLLFLLIPMATMMAVSRLYTTQEDQINDHGGIYGVSSMLVGMVVLIGGAVFLRARPKLQTLYIAVLGPQLFLTGLIYVYQFVTIGRTEYFFTKNMALLLCLAGVFFVAAGLKALAGLKLQIWPLVMAPILTIAFAANLLILTGQEISAVKTQRQASSQLELGTADVFARLASDGTVMQRNVIFFTQLDYGGDVDGNVMSTALHKPATRCIGGSIWMITDHRGKDFPKRVAECVQEEPDKPVTIITSGQTEPLFAELRSPSIQTVVAY